MLKKQKLKRKDQKIEKEALNAIHNLFFQKLNQFLQSNKTNELNIRDPQQQAQRATSACATNPIPRTVAELKQQIAPTQQRNQTNV
jgi:hypothetical protein